MGAIYARVSATLPTLLWGILITVVTWLGSKLGLPDLDRLREILERIQEILTVGGVALALGVSLVFILAWVLSHLRRPKKTQHKLLSTLALYSSYAPVALTAAAAAGTVVPFLAVYVLQLFAVAVLVAAVSWNISIATLIVGGCRSDLARARKALLLAGTPWYCLAIWISTFL